MIGADCDARGESWSPRGRPGLPAVLGQVLLALVLILVGAYVFVEATQRMALVGGIPPLVFALVVAPVATELPEKLNSVIWMRRGKDTLALGNISGAMVFQATVPVWLGILLTEWHFGAELAGRAALVSAAIALGSALVFFIALRLGAARPCRPGRCCWAGLWWMGYLVFVLANVSGLGEQDAAGCGGAGVHCRACSRAGAWGG